MARLISHMEKILLTVKQCRENLSSGFMTMPKVIKLFSCSSQLSMKFILLIYFKMPAIAGY